MIINEELSATLDQPTDCLIMHRVEPSRLQMLALNLTDKIQMLAENNEQILEPRTGRAGYSGTGAWFPGRERQGEKQKGGTGNFQVGLCHVRQCTFTLDTCDFLSGLFL